MATLEIIVRQGAQGGWAVVAEYTSDADPLPLRREGLLDLDQSALLAQALVPRAYGAILGQALFRDEIGRIFEQALARVGDGTLRLLLFVEDPELHQIRWERLCAYVENDWQPLATYQRVPFSRYLPSQADRRFPPIARHDMRALVVAASPAGSKHWGLPRFDEAAAVKGVTGALDAAGVPYTLLSTGPDAAGPPTLDAICEQISQRRITLLHVVAHGRAVADGSVLYLSQADNHDQVDPIVAARLIDRLNDLKSPPHLTFLCTCESAQEEHDGALGGLGQQLVLQLGTPAVVAMADRVSVATATALSASFYSQLLERDGEAEGAVDLALVKATAGLAEQADITVPVLFSRLGARPLFTRAAQRAPDADEVKKGLSMLAELVAERAPVLTAELECAAAAVQAYLDAPEESLTAEARAELVQARAEIEKICAEAVELPFAALATGTPPPRYDGATCPFPGLTAFSEEQHRFFFGREALVETLVEQLERQRTLAVSGSSANGNGRQRFLAVSGSSGSGKSSAVLAGVVPRLRELRPGLELLAFTPGELPLATLELTLHEAQQRGARDLVVVIDQFEELFVFGSGEDFEREERRPFIERLRRLADEQTVIVSVRTDFLEACGRYTELNALFTGSTVVVQPLGAEELREAVERQAGAVGLRFEGGLTETILDDVRGERGVMPMAQHALRELWQRRRGRWLRTSEYVELGGIKEAIARTTDQIFARNDDPEAQERLREIFLRLTRLDRDPPAGDEPADTRQRVNIDELVPAGESRERIETLLRQLEDARIVMRDRAMVEVAHEAIIRSWKRLRGWIDDDRQLLLRLDDLRQAAADWKRRDEAPDRLWSGGRLAQAEGLAQLPRFKLNAQEQAFLDASIEARRREQEEQLAQLQKERQLRAEAETSRQRAEQEARRARDAALVAAEAQRVAEQEAEKARLAREESIVARTRAEESQKLARQEATEAERQRDIARQEEERAKKAEDVVRTKALQLQRRFWIMVGLAGLATVLALFSVWQNAESRRLALIAEARADLELGDLDGALAVAAQAPEDPRLTQVFAEAANAGARRVHNGFENTVNAVAFSPDGATYLAVGWDGRLEIWDRASGKVVRSYRELSGDEGVGLTAAVFTLGEAVIGTEDGRLIAVGAASGLPFAQKANGEVRALAVSPDGAVILSGDTGGMAALWDVRQRARLRTLFTATGQSVVAVGFLEGGRAAVVGTSAGEVHRFDTAAWAELSTFELRRPDAPDHDGDLRPNACLLTAMTVLPHPAGEQILAGCDDGTIEAWSPTGDFLAEFRGHEAPVLSLAAVPGREGGFVSSSFDQTMRLWDYTSQMPVRQFPGHPAEVYSLAASPDGTQILSGSYDNTVRLWDVTSGLQEQQYLLSTDAPLDTVVGLVSHADGSLAAADGEGMLVEWQGDGAVTQTWQVPGAALALSADGRRALIQLSEGEVAFWDVAGRTELSRFAADLPKGVRVVAALSADGSQALLNLASGDSELRAADGTLLHTFPVAAEGEYYGVAYAFAFSPDGTRALISYDDRTLALWSVPDGTQIGDWLQGHSDQITSVAFSPDGLRAVSGAWDKTARVWDLEQGGEPVVLRGHTRTVSAVAFSPDGRTIVTGSYDHTIRLWDATEGLELMVLGTQQGDPSVVTFSPDGQAVLTGSDLGEVQRLRVLIGATLVEWLGANRAMPDR